MERRTPVSVEHLSVRGENRVFTIDVPAKTKRIIGIQVSTKLTGESMPVNRHYYGNAVVPGAYDDAFIQSLSNEQMESTVKVFSVNANPGQKIFYARPSRLDGNPSFEIDAASAGFTYKGKISVTDAETGYVEDYTLFESNDGGLGQVELYVY